MTMDGTVDLKDTSAVGQDASKGTQETSQAKTYLESDVQKIVNDRLAQAGRAAKALEAKEAELSAREEAHNQWLRERDEEEYEKARGNPDALSALQRERVAKTEARKIKEERDALERDRVAFQVERDADNVIKKEQKITELAAKYQVNIADLKEFDLGIEAIEKLAMKLSPIPQADLAKTAKVEPKKRDSGVTLGGGSTRLGDLSPKDRLKEIDRRLREQQ